MRSRTGGILKLVMMGLIAISYQSCDSTLNIERPSTFIKYIGADGNQTGIDMATDVEGNIYILGSSSTATGKKQVYVVKTNPDGIVQWEKVYGDGNEENPKDIETLTNGNLAIVADRTDATGEKDIIIYLLSSADGATMATPRVAGYPSVPDYANSITETNNGYIVCVYTERNSGTGTFKDASIFRFNNSLQQYPTSSGWVENISQTLAKSGNDFVPVKMFQVREDLFYLFGYTNSPLGLADNIPDYNFFIYVSGPQNDLLNYLVVTGDDPSSNERMTSAKLAKNTAGAGYILGGYTSNGDGSQQNLYLVRILQELEPFVSPAKQSDPHSFIYGDPTTITSKLATTPTSGANVFFSSKSDFLVLGEQVTDGYTQLLLTRVNDNYGNVWSDPGTTRVFGGVGNDRSGAVAEANDGGILVCGTMVLGDALGQQKIVLMKLNPDGMLGK